MEPAQAKPVRRRRRWLIAALLLVLVSGVAWWEWRRNAMFVGRWQVVDLRDGDRIGELAFDCNGTAVFQSIFDRSVFYRWNVLGDELRLIRFSKLEPTLFDRAVFKITRLLPLVSQIDRMMNVPAFEGRFRVRSIDSEKLEMRHIAGESPF